MNKMLVALDDSASSMNAVEYVARQFGGAQDVQIGLVHVLPNLPAIFWDEGHILSEEEKRERRKVVDKWVTDRKAKMDPVFKKATDLLLNRGIKAGQIQARSVSDSTDIADSILEQAKDEGYQTIVIGRCDRSAKHVLGSITSKIVDQGRGFVITIVE